MTDEQALALVDEAVEAAIAFNKELGGTMTTDQEYWYQEGYRDGVEKHTITLDIIEKVLTAESDAEPELRELVKDQTKLSVEEYCKIVQKYIK